MKHYYGHVREPQDPLENLTRTLTAAPPDTVHFHRQGRTTKRQLQNFLFLGGGVLHSVAGGNQSPSRNLGLMEWTSDECYPRYPRIRNTKMTAYHLWCFNHNFTLKCFFFPRLPDVQPCYLHPTPLHNSIVIPKPIQFDS